MSTLQIVLIIIIVGYILHIFSSKLDETLYSLQEMHEDVRNLKNKLEDNLDYVGLTEDLRLLNSKVTELEHHIYDVKEHFDIDEESLEEKRKIDADSKMFL